MRVRKRILIRERIRRPPREGWSWIDRRFVREYAEGLEPEGILLYLFLVAVSDRDGLSYWSDPAIAGRLRIPIDDVVRARDALEAHDLIAYRDPLYQVLSLPAPRPRESRCPGPTAIGDILAELAARAGPTPPASRKEVRRDEGVPLGGDPPPPRGRAPHDACHRPPTSL